MWDLPCRCGSRAAGGAAGGRSPAHRTTRPTHHPREGSCPTRTESLTSVTDASRDCANSARPFPHSRFCVSFALPGQPGPDTAKLRLAAQLRTASSDAAAGNPRGSPQGGGAPDAREGRKSGEGHPRAVAQTRCIGLPQHVPVVRENLGEQRAVAHQHAGQRTELAARPASPNGRFAGPVPPFLRRRPAPGFVCPAHCPTRAR